MSIFRPVFWCQNNATTFRGLQPDFDRFNVGNKSTRRSIPMNAPAPTKRRRGRPPKKSETKRAAFQTRLHPSLRDRLQEAADEAGRSLSEEVEQRLLASFDRVESHFGGPVGFNAALMLFANFRHAGNLRAQANGHPEWGIAQWLHDADCFERALAELVRSVWSQHPNEAVTTADFIRWLKRLKHRAMSAARSGFIEDLEPAAKRAPKDQE
jgi:hypothetical protein